MRRSVTVVLSVLFLMSIGFSPSWGREAKYRIGGLFAVTGPAAWLGDPEKKSLELMVEQINKEGGINGHKVEAVIYDTQGSPQLAVLKARRLVTKDKVMAIIGTSRTPTSAAVMKALQLEKLNSRFAVPMVSCAAGKILTSPVKPWLFTTPQTNALAVEKVLEYLAKAHKTKVGMLYVSNAFGEDGYNNLKRLAPKYGISVVGVETYGGGDRDMTAQLTKLADHKPQAIINWSVGPTSVVVTKNFKQLGLEKKGMLLVMNHGQGNVKYIELCGKAAEGVILPAGKILATQNLSPNDPQTAMLKSFKEMYEKAYKEQVSPFAGHAYDAMLLIKRALEKGKVKPGDKKGLRKALETYCDGVVGVDGVFHYSPTDHNGLSKNAMVMLKVENGAFTLLK